MISGLILEHLEWPGIARLLMADLSKAFDPVLPSHCIEQLAKHNAPLECLYWLHSYLRGRKQTVRIGSTYSQPAVFHRAAYSDHCYLPLLCAVFSQLTKIVNILNMPTILPSYVVLEHM